MTDTNDNAATGDNVEHGEIVELRPTSGPPSQRRPNTATR